MKKFLIAVVIVAGLLLSGCDLYDAISDMRAAERAVAGDYGEETSTQCVRFTKMIMKQCNSDGWKKSTGAIGETDFMTCFNLCSKGKYRVRHYAKDPGECWKEISSENSEGIDCK